jgi:hypothetical protein
MCNPRASSCFYQKIRIKINFKKKEQFFTAKMVEKFIQLFSPLNNLLTILIFHPVNKTVSRLNQNPKLESKRVTYRLKRVGPTQDARGGFTFSDNGVGRESATLTLKSWIKERSQGGVRCIQSGWKEETLDISSSSR